MAKYRRLKHTILKIITTVFISMLLLTTVFLQEIIKNDKNIVKAYERAVEYQWNNAVYGNGSSASKSKIIGNASKGNVIIDSNSGKIVPDSTDGIAFHYTAVPVETNFTLRAKVTVNSWTFTNGQEGFGLMATDWVGAHEGICWTNSYMLGASRIDYYIDKKTHEPVTNTNSAYSTKIMQNIGILGQEKKGVTLDNIQALEANDTQTIKDDYRSSRIPMNLMEEYLVSGNIIGNESNHLQTTVDNPITQMYLTIQKNNTGYFLQYEDMSGYVYTHQYYNPTALQKIDTNYVYVGFYAARTTNITFSDITFSTIPASQDEEAKEPPVEKIAVNESVQSLTATGISDYKLEFTANCDGKVSVSDNSGKIIAQDVKVTANKSAFVAQTKLEEGKNVFTLIFTPDKDYHPDNNVYKEMESYEPVQVKHTVTYKTYGKPGQAIYVAPNAVGNGSKENPMNIYNAVQYIQPGQQIILTEGTYYLNKTLNIARGIDGTPDNPIVMMTDPQALSRPVLDFQGMSSGIILGGSYWYVKGFDVIHSQNSKNGFIVAGNHNVLNEIHAYYNGNTGISISRYKDTDEKERWPSYNLILNCTAYNNADMGYEDADGFAAKITSGVGNVFDGCIAHHNADDGWDLFAKVQIGTIGSVTIRNCVAYENGYVIKDDDGNLDINGNHKINAGNGNGFKMGGESLSGYHILENSVSYGNKAKGIDANSCPDIQVKKCVSYNNGNANIALYTGNAPNTDYSMQYTISYKNNNNVTEIIKPKGIQDISKYDNDTNYFWRWTSGNKVHNSADEKLGVVNWFASLDTNREPTRNADGTIHFGDLFTFTDKAPETVRLNGYDNTKGMVSPIYDVFPDIYGNPPTKIKYGDIDSNGEINTRDAVLLKKYLAKMQVVIDEKAADVNVDGNVDIQDAILLMKYLAKMDIVLGK